MEYRPLGRTGVQVSKLCLGTMMFGAWGNADHDDSIRIIHRALDAGINFVDTADVYSAGESEEIVGKALKGRRDDVVLATKFLCRWTTTQPPRRFAPLDHHRSRELAASPRHRLDRPLPGPPPRPGHRRRRNARRADRPRPPGQGPLHRLVLISAGEIVEAQWTARERRLERFRTEQPPYSILVRGIELDVLPTAQRHGMGILTYSPLAGGWLSGRWSADSAPTSPAQQRLAARFDMSLPENQRKLEAVEQLATLADEAGLSLIELAIAFVVNHPGRDLSDHRTTHDRAARQPAARRRRRARPGDPRPRRRDRPARRQPQPCRHQLRRAGAPATPPTAVDRTPGGASAAARQPPRHLPLTQSATPHEASHPCSSPKPRTGACTRAAVSRSTSVPRSSSAR